MQLTFCPEMPYSCGGNHDDLGRLLASSLSAIAAPRHFLAERASATAADVQVFVELFIQLVLLGIEYRHILLLDLFRRSCFMHLNMMFPLCAVVS